MILIIIAILLAAFIVFTLLVLTRPVRVFEYRTTPAYYRGIGVGNEFIPPSGKGWQPAAFLKEANNSDLVVVWKRKVSK